MDWYRPFDASYRLVAVDRATGAELGEVAGAVSGGSISRSQDTEAKESATVDVVGLMPLGPCLVRVYLDARQGAETCSECLGTFVPNAPESTFDGSSKRSTLNLAGRLSELSGDVFDAPVSYPRGTAVLPEVCKIARGAGLDVVQLDESASVLSGDRTYGLGDEGGSDSKLSVINDLLSLAGFSSASTDPWGRVVLKRSQDISERQTSWKMHEGRTARFLRVVDEELDESAVKNAVRAVFSDQGSTVVGVAEDRDPAGRWSIPVRGYRDVATYRFSGPATQEEADAKALSLLRTQQSAVHRVTVHHVYAPIRPGDVVDLRYGSAGIEGRLAVRTMDLDLGPGCMTTTEMREFVR